MLTRTRFLILQIIFRLHSPPNSAEAMNSFDLLCLTHHRFASAEPAGLPLSHTNATANASTFIFVVVRVCLKPLT